MNKDAFLNSEHKAITFMGMSGVGKTHVSDKLKDCGWFHYSCDVEIGTNALQDDIIDTIKQDILSNPSLRKFLEAGAIEINNNISAKNLDTLSAFIGQIGNPTQGRIGNIHHGGIALEEFKRRQSLYYHAECQSLLQVGDKISEAKAAGFTHFVNDSTGSMCEVEDESIIQVVDQASLIVYIKATEEDIENVKKRARSNPKPLLFPASKFDGWLQSYMDERGLKSTSEIEPDDFSRSNFSLLLEHRLPRYDAIADRYGVTVSSEDFRDIQSEQDVLDVIAGA